MNDPTYPFHAVGYFDCHGSPPSLSGLPREEEDFRTLRESVRWLEDRGGGTIEVFTGSEWKRVGSFEPDEEGEAFFTV